MPEKDAREDVLRARAERERAEAQKFLAEAKSLEITVKVNRSVAEANAINLAKARRQEKRELASDEYHHIYVFDGAVNEGSVERCIDQLKQWIRNDPKCAIEIIFFSPGGEVLAGMALFDFIRQVREMGHHVTTTALGVAASMAGILLQAGDTRVVGREAWVLIHEASFGAIGKIGEVEDRVNMVKRLHKRILRIFAERSNLSVRQIAQRWKRKDWWLDSDDCLKLGFVDEVR